LKKEIPTFLLVLILMFLGRATGDFLKLAANDEFGRKLQDLKLIGK